MSDWVLQSASIALGPLVLLLFAAKRKAGVVVFYGLGVVTGIYIVLLLLASAQFLVFTSFMRSVRANDFATARLMLEEHPWLLSARSFTLRLPLTLVIDCHDPAAVRFIAKEIKERRLIDHSSMLGEGLLLDATLDGCCAQALLENGVDPRYQHARGKRLTALHIATARSDISMIRLLLTYGADPAQTDGLGRTATDLAHGAALAEIERLLSQSNGP